MYIGRILEATDDLCLAMERLIPQLGVHKIPPTRHELTELINRPGSSLLVARYPDESGKIVGILSLTVYLVPTGKRSIIEDVVVDEKMRRMGIGEALVRQAIELARESGANGVSLTSNPQREAANKLYLAMGFELRKTNPYFYKFE